jgi:hypothetical protein
MRANCLLLLLQPWQLSIAVPLLLLQRVLLQQLSRQHCSLLGACHLKASC